MPLPDLENDQEIWEVEDIKAHIDLANNRRKYLVKWKDWPAEYNTWEPDEHLKGAKTVLNRYLKKRKIKQ